MGAQCGPNMMANSGGYNYLSKFSKVSFSGFINENYYSITSQEKNLVENLELTHALARNPVTKKMEAFIALLLKSKYDGIGNRTPIELSIALDISGSMSVIDDSPGQSRLNLAKDALKKLVSIMDEKNDKMSLITFNHNTNKIFGLSSKEEIQQKYLNQLEAIKANGNTDLYAALKEAMNNINLDGHNNKGKRIVLITDAYYKDTSEKLFQLFEQCVNEKGVPITIMAISSESNLILADKLSHFKGCNYFTITKSTDLENYLVKHFNYTFFPIAYNTKIKIYSGNSKIVKCLGGDQEVLDEYESFMNSSSQDNAAPNALNEIVFDLGTSFSSELLKIKGNNGEEQLYSKGGLILLKIDSDALAKHENIKIDFSLEYESYEGQKSLQNYEYIIPKSNGDINEFFCNNNIRKGISIYFFSNILNYICELNNRGEYEKKKDDKNKERDLYLVESKKTIIEFLNKNFIVEPDNQETKKIKQNYIKMIDDRYEKFKKVVFIFYNIIVVPVPY